MIRSALAATVLLLAVPAAAPALAQGQQEALDARYDRALAAGAHWEAVTERRFSQPVHYASFEDFAQRMLYPSFADHGITPALVERVR
jgi:hypothetical protein